MAMPPKSSVAAIRKTMGAPMGMDPTGAINLSDVEEARNVAMVFVTARVPDVGAQSGDLLDVSVNAIGARASKAGR